MKTMNLNIEPDELAEILEGHLQRNVLKADSVAHVVGLNSWMPPNPSQVSSRCTGVMLTVQISPKDKS